LLVAQNISIQGWSPFSNLESDFAPERNPSRAAECQHALALLRHVLSQPQQTRAFRARCPPTQAIAQQASS
jgi:hypothetical protein